MVVLFNILLLLKCFAFFELWDISTEWGCGVSHCCMSTIYIITAPIVAKRIYEEMEVNRHNVSQLENFHIINECADQYTNVDVDMIDAELDYAHELSQNIAVCFWLTMTLFILEIVLICVAICMANCCPSYSRDDSDYYRAVDAELAVFSEPTPRSHRSSSSSSDKDPEAKFRKQ